MTSSPVSTTTRPGRLRVRTVALPEPVDLLSLLPRGPVTSWVHGDDGLVAWGEAATLAVTGQERFSRAHRWWSQLCDDAEISDDVAVPGSGPVAFASFTFARGPQSSCLIVPEVILGRRNGKSWLTLIGDAADFRGGQPDLQLLPQPDPVAPGAVTEHPGSITTEQWGASVEEALARIAGGGLDKVVLARDVLLTAESEIDPRYLLRRLAASYPDCWSFSVAGMVGATPELLVRRTGAAVTSRVLAGTVHRDADSGRDGRLAEALLSSDKDLVEHLYAVQSVSAALATHCTNLTVPANPSLLQLANVQHLATDVTGLLAEDVSAIALAASLHPTAAVCGTPTEWAAAVIAELEGMDRGRYAGPVGWVDANGDGEFGIALRCGQLTADARAIRLFAGCGIVAGSTAESELAESESKLEAMRDALGG